MKLQVKVSDPKTGQIEQQAVVDFHGSEPSLSRREALGKLMMGGASAVAFLSGASTFLSGCIGETEVKFGTFEVDSSAIEGCVDKVNTAPVACTTAAAQTVKSVELRCISKGAHDHAIDLTPADIDAGVAIPLIYLLSDDTAGKPVSHVHWFALSQEQVVSLKAGTKLQIETASADSAAAIGQPADEEQWGHTHLIEVSCLA